MANLDIVICDLCMDAERNKYNILLVMSSLYFWHQNARAVLPTCTATVLMATHNLREWRHIFQERLFNTHAHPDMRFLMKIVFDDMNSRYPTIFNNLVVKEL